jgi:hypothetical protein
MNLPIYRRLCRYSLPDGLEYEYNKKEKELLLSALTFGKYLCFGKKRTRVTVLYEQKMTSEYYCIDEREAASTDSNNLQASQWEHFT